MGRSRLVWIWPLVVWTVFVWVSRVRNVLGNDDLSGGAKLIRLVVVLVFLAFAFWAAQALWRSRGAEFASTDRFIIGLLALWTIGFWIFRDAGILLGDETVGFKVVHAVLGVVSIALAGMALFGIKHADPRAGMRSGTVSRSSMRS